MMEMVKVYYDEDVDLSILKDKTIAVIGYGNQGRAQALNMRDSGLKVIVGNIKDNYWEKAVTDGFETYEISDATKKSDIILILLPDEIQPTIYEKEIKNNLSEGKVLCFASGYTVHFKLIEPPDYVSVILVAPKMIGEGIRRLFVQGLGFPVLIAVHQDVSGNAKEIALAIAKAIGGTRVGAFESSFKEEAETDLFGEQVLGGSYIYSVMACYETLIEAGYNPEAVLLELYASGEIIEVMRGMIKHGLIKQLSLHSPTSQYGQLTRGKRLVTEETKKVLKNILEEIQTGNFVKEWSKEYSSGYMNFRKLKEESLKHPINKTEEEIKKHLRYEKMNI